MMRYFNELVGGENQEYMNQEENIYLQYVLQYIVW